MANGETKNKTITIRQDDALHAELKPKITRSGYKSPDFTRACMMYAQSLFLAEKHLVAELVENWDRLHPKTDELRKDIRESASFEAHFKKVCSAIGCDLNSYTNASLIQFSSFFAEHPYMIPTILARTLSNQFASCMSAPRQTCMSDCLQGGAVGNQIKSA